MNDKLLSLVLAINVVFMSCAQKSTLKYGEWDPMVFDSDELCFDSNEGSAIVKCINYEVISGAALKDIENGTRVCSERIGQGGKEWEIKGNGISVSCCGNNEMLVKVIGTTDSRQWILETNIWDASGSIIISQNRR